MEQEGKEKPVRQFPDLIEPHVTLLYWDSWVEIIIKDFCVIIKQCKL